LALRIDLENDDRIAALVPIIPQAIVKRAGEAGARVREEPQNLISDRGRRLYPATEYDGR